MKTVKYVPTACKGENPKFSGEIELRLPTFDEKYEYIEQSNINVGENGEVENMGMTTQVSIIRKFVKASAKHYLTVSLKKLETGEEFKSFDDLQYDAECHPILVEIATQLVHGFKLGNG